MMASATKNEQRLQEEDTRQEQIERYKMTALSSEELVELLGDADWTVMQAAQHVLLTRGVETLDALVIGLRHFDKRIRATCAGLMDHLGDDRCTKPLSDVLKNDSQESVRRNALHSLACQGCKACPLTGDILAPIMDAALHDRSIVVRRRALQYLVGQKRDGRAMAVAQQVLASESDLVLLRRAERVLAWHNSPPE